MERAGAVALTPHAAPDQRLTTPAGRGEVPDYALSQDS
jgi:hypothetical protein